MEIGVVLVVLLALAFDYTNGFHDAANSIATVVSTRVLSPRWAVVCAAFFNFAAFILGKVVLFRVVFGTHVASTIAKDVVSQNGITIGVVFAGLLGAVGWNLLTFYLGLPTSSSHALVGGIAGAAVARAGWSVLQEDGLRKIGLFIVLSPLIGLALGLIVTIAIQWAFHRLPRLQAPNPGFRPGQLFSGAGLPRRPAPPAPEPGLPPWPAVRGRRLQPRSWRQRRAEDDGCHPGRADRHQA